MAEEKREHCPGQLPSFFRCQQQTLTGKDPVARSGCVREEKEKKKEDQSDEGRRKTGRKRNR